jgi:uncharacterized protein (TIGR02266 family)
MKHFHEKRVYQRRPYRTKVVFEDELGDGLFYVYSSDISMGGLYLASDIPAKQGTMLFLSFALPGHKRPVRATGEIVRREGGGMGVRFVGLSGLTMERLSAFLEVHS